MYGNIMNIRVYYSILCTYCTQISAKYIHARIYIGDIYVYRRGWGRGLVC